jgi:hypothetical protein
VLGVRAERRVRAQRRVRARRLTESLRQQKKVAEANKIELEIKKHGGRLTPMTVADLYR